MGFVRELLLLCTYFILLSTTLQSQDAYVFFYQSQFTPDQDTSRPSRLRRLFIFALFALLNYLTNVVTPYINQPIRKIALAGCVILFAKYACQLLTFTNIMINILELSAILFDVVGTAVFYLTSIRAVQVLCQKYQYLDLTGKAFAVFSGLFALSIVLGNAISYGCFRQLPLWAYLIVLTCMTILSGVICFFAFPLERRSAPANELQQQHPAEPSPNNQEQQPQENQPAVDQIYRSGATLGQVIKMTFFMYKKMILIASVQMALGFLMSYSSSLLEFLIWTTQTESMSERLTHNLDVIILFGGGAIVGGIITGFLSDCISIRKIGYLVCILTSLTCSFLYMAIFIKYFYTTLLLYFFIGISIFSMATWLLCVCSKVYAGKFQSFAVNSQFIALSSCFYQMGTIVFEGKIGLQFKFCFQLGVLILSSLFCIFFIRKLPLGQMDIIFEQSQIDESQVTQRREEPQIEIEMTEQAKNQKIQQTLGEKEPEKKIDQDYLL